jgi:hypothetical protein
MIPSIIAFAILASFSTLIFRVILPHRPFFLTGAWAQVIVSSLFGISVWIVLVLRAYPFGLISEIEIWDVVCGVLIHLCALWCNYWICNLSGGFRAQMAITLADQTCPVTLEEWMVAFGGLGMNAFLKDRMTSILIPWKIAFVRNDKLTLLPGWGLFFGRLMVFLEIVLYRVRSF